MLSRDEAHIFFSSKVQGLPTCCFIFPIFDLAGSNTVKAAVVVPLRWWARTGHRGRGWGVGAGVGRVVSNDNRLSVDWFNLI